MPMGIETKMYHGSPSRTSHVAIDGECRWALKPLRRHAVLLGGDVAIDGECRWALKPPLGQPSRHHQRRRNRRRMPMGIETIQCRPDWPCRMIVAIDGECRWALKPGRTRWPRHSARVAIDGECRWALKPARTPRILARPLSRRNRRRMPMGIET